MKHFTGYSVRVMKPTAHGSHRAQEGRRGPRRGRGRVALGVAAEFVSYESDELATAAGDLIAGWVLIGACGRGRRSGVRDGVFVLETAEDALIEDNLALASEDDGIDVDTP